MGRSKQPLGIMRRGYGCLEHIYISGENHISMDNKDFLITYIYALHLFSYNMSGNRKILTQ